MPAGCCRARPGNSAASAPSSCEVVTKLVRERKSQQASRTVLPKPPLSPSQLKPPKVAPSLSPLPRLPAVAPSLSFGALLFRSHTQCNQKGILFWMFWIAS